VFIINYIQAAAAAAADMAGAQQWI